MNSIQLALLILNIIILINVILTSKRPLISWKNILNYINEISLVSNKRKKTKYMTLALLEKLCYFMNYLAIPTSLFIIIYLGVTSPNKTDISVYDLVSIPSAITIALTAAMFIMGNLGDSKGIEGILDTKLKGYLMSENLKDVMHKDIYKIYIDFRQNKRKPENIENKNTLSYTAYRFSLDLQDSLSTVKRSGYIFDFITRPKNISLLAAISNVILDAEKIRFVDSSDGLESREVYIEKLTKLYYDMLDYVDDEVSKDNKEKEVKSKIMNKELINNLNNSLDNEFYII